MTKSLNYNNFFIVFISFCLFSSCVSQKRINYLQFGEVDQSKVNNNYQLTFKSDDLLQITVSSDDIESVQPFNLPVISYSNLTNSALGTPQLQSYLVDSKGYIDFPILGKLKVSGLNRIELINLIKKKLMPDYIVNPIVNVKLSNFKITINGDVKNPGTFEITNERISIFDAIGLAGDLNLSARRDELMVLREEHGQKKFYKINLLSNKTLESPVYYLKQNDVVFVYHNKAKIQDSVYNRNTGLFISLGSVLISLLTLLNL